MNKTTEMVYWITERERMRIRRGRNDYSYAHGYSPDPHMGLVRYCNVRREDDKVTKWLAKNWRPSHHAVWEIVLARMINYIPSLEDTLPWMDGKHLGAITDCLKERRTDGEKIFTSAYTISTCGESMDKIDYVMRVVGNVKDWPDMEEWSGLPITLAEIHEHLMKVKGIGSFLAAQVIADLKNTAGHPLQSAPDWHSWAAHGPGSLKGLAAYLGRRVAPSGFACAATAAWEEVRPLLPEDLRNLHMQDFQNCLCEFSKYIRVKEHNGHVRNRYTATPG